MVQQDKEILEYLNLELDESGQEFEADFKKINVLQSQDLNPKPSKWRELNQRRLLASGTNRRREGLIHWDEANCWMGEQLSQGKTLNWDAIYNINSLSTGSESKLRKAEIYTGDMEYLSSKFLESSIKIFENKILESVNLSPIMKAFEVYVWVVTLHPFSDGNGRTSRLAADWILLQNGYLPLFFINSVQSHVALLKNAPPKEKAHSFLKFLKAIVNSYEFILKSNE